jgi:hypothetical protein
MTTIMEKTKTSKKALQGLINDSMQEALKSLELPPPGKKAKRLLRSNAKKLASIFANVIKRQDKKKRKAQKFMENAVSGKSKKDAKPKKMKFEKIDIESV